MNKAKITLDGKTTIEVELTPAQEALIRQGLIGGYSIQLPPEEPKYKHPCKGDKCLNNPCCEEGLYKDVNGL